MRRDWHEVRDGTTFRLSRRVPFRWDVSATAILPDLGRRRLAHAVRQDMWRMLRIVRGFQPVVEVNRTEAGCVVRAGGTVAAEGRDLSAGVRTTLLSARVRTMLDDPDKREAWVRAARHRSVA